jgi:uncharacterized protein YabN with tetrapyrrole methylase and pyrophosphatase domain
MRAQKLQKKAARAGFDWADAAPVLDKIREEADEIAGAMARMDQAAIEDEVGDLLFSVVNLARKLGVDAEVALSGANEKFTARFSALEQRVESGGRKLEELSLADMDAVWDEVKASAQS